MNSIQQAPELVEAMKDTMERELELRIKSVRKETNWNQFYLIYHMKPDVMNPKVIREGWIASEMKPPQISGCLLFFIDWTRGICECENIISTVIDPRERHYMELIGKKSFKN